MSLEKECMGKQVDRISPFVVRFAERVKRPQFVSGLYGDPTTVEYTTGGKEDTSTDDN